MVDATVGAMIAATVSATTALPVADRQPMMHETLCISLSVRLHLSVLLCQRVYSDDSRIQQNGCCKQMTRTKLPDYCVEVRTLIITLHRSSDVSLVKLAAFSASAKLFPWSTNQFK